MSDMLSLSHGPHIVQRWKREGWTEKANRWRQHVELLRMRLGKRVRVKATGQVVQYDLAPRVQWQRNKETVLILHDMPGGIDQALAVADGLRLHKYFNVVTLSRPGYLGTSLHFDTLGQAERQRLKAAAIAARNELHQSRKKRPLHRSSHYQQRDQHLNAIINDYKKQRRYAISHTAQALCIMAFLEEMELAQEKKDAASIDQGPIHLIGVGAGAVVALYMAQLQPARIGRVILTGIGWNPDDHNCGLMSLLLRPLSNLNPSEQQAHYNMNRTLKENIRALAERMRLDGTDILSSPCQIERQLMAYANGYLTHVYARQSLELRSYELGTVRRDKRNQLRSVAQHFAEVDSHMHISIAATANVASFCAMMHTFSPAVKRWYGFVADLFNMYRFWRYAAFHSPEDATIPGFSWADLASKMLVVHGHSDGIGHLKDAEQVVHRAIGTDAQLFVVEETGHTVWLGPQRYVVQRRILKFLLQKDREVVLQQKKGDVNDDGNDSSSSSIEEDDDIGTTATAVRFADQIVEQIGDMWNKASRQHSDYKVVKDADKIHVRETADGDNHVTIHSKNKKKGL
jgi:pimeloyl-ACP methyl ester carboxylesterase